MGIMIRRNIVRMDDKKCLVHKIAYSEIGVCPECMPSGDTAGIFTSDPVAAKNGGDQGDGEGPAPGFWNIIQTQEFGIEDIRKRIVKALTAELNAFQSVKLSYTTPESREKIINGIKNIAQEAVKQSFGLMIVVWNIYRTNRSNDGFAEMIQTLRKNKWEAIADGDYEHAADLDVRMKRLMESEGYVQKSLPSPDLAMIETDTDWFRRRSLVFFFYSSRKNRNSISRTWRVW